MGFVIDKQGDYLPVFAESSGGGGGDYLNTNASNLSSTGKKVFDGQWVCRKIQITGGYVDYPTSEPTEFDLSSYLPDDEYDYEVVVSGVARSGTTIDDYVRIELGSDIFTSSVLMADNRCVISGKQNGASGTVTIPVGQERKLVVFHLSWVKGDYSLWTVGYRRIGTNN